MSQYAIKPNVVSINNIVYNTLYSNIVQKNTINDTISYKIQNNRTINKISNNTNKPIASTIHPDHMHPSLLNYSTLTNTFIRNGYYVPYNPKFSIPISSIEEIFYI